MACTCRVPTKCPNCNFDVRVPLSRLDADEAAALVERVHRRDTSLSRANLTEMARGETICPLCGAPVLRIHERGCVNGALSALGLKSHERDGLLARMSFPE